jgi:hypothetical protein
MTQSKISGWKKNVNPKNDAHETFVLVYNKNINALVQDLTHVARRTSDATICRMVFWNMSDAHEMTLPSPQRPYNSMLMMKRRHEC